MATHPCDHPDYLLEETRIRGVDACWCGALVLTGPPATRVVLAPSSATTPAPERGRVSSG
jgi:hypothetical protein